MPRGIFCINFFILLLLKNIGIYIKLLYSFSQCDIKKKETETLTEELLAKQTTLNSTASELQQLRDMSAHQRKRIAEMLANFLKDLGEIGVAIGGDENLKVNLIY